MNLPDEEFDSHKKLETILVIDDSPTNLEILHDVLGGAGFEVLVEMDGISGIEQVENNPPDLILLDVMMPKIDGFETCRRLQANPSTKHIPIIFITALTEAQEKVKGLKLGAVDYITKPFEQNEVLARINLHLKLCKLNLELDKQKQELEIRVQERTLELSQAVEELKKTQLQLVQTEKISSLGQLVAGVAHEVNNPIGFISTNLHYANQYIEDLLKLVQLFQQSCSNPGIEVEEQIEIMDLQHIKKDLPKLMSSMKLGTDTIKGIMQSLRNFSRTDGQNKKLVDIHEGIEATLMILQHRLKAYPKRPAIQVIKNYSILPKIKCYPGQLNQVFMNLLANAIDVLEESIIEGQNLSNDHIITNPQIRIATTIDKHQVTVKISDNGKGMSESIRSDIFQAFFTTKPEGKGTGLGLSISYQIITENHGGNLECISAPGKGTEFLIQIPF
ncbi:MAG: response regulator [Richelia sp. RM2_1_2]|nr:response regulator [Richelia sp. SM2_1_7]NJM19256.1 response regulator [Richelia sp. SM1_7_0]NJN10853.1 response regulator [Richelia sp. RM1_1_1]NJO30023.1 response regulator [Richelia sp. SL_2_1]NJO61449.1 response regulator [Richelia sp. RM2_1_2]